MTIANPHLFSNPAKILTNNRLRRFATVASVTVAGILILAKTYAYVTTDSVTLLSSLMDSTMDIIASIITMISVRHALEPADEAHRYGHDKVEALAALGQSIFIMGSSFFLYYQSLNRIFNPVPVKETGMGIAIMALSIVLTASLVVLQKYVVKKTGSVAIAADEMHYRGDLLMNVTVIAALLLSQFKVFPHFDALCALMIAIFMMREAFNISKSTFDILLDAEIPEQEREKIYNLVLKHKDARAIHDLRTRTTGHRIYIEFHLELDGNLTLNDAHDVTEDIEHILYHEFPTSEVLIHQEPAGIDDHRIDHKITQK